MLCTSDKQNGCTTGDLSRLDGLNVKKGCGAEMLH